MNKEGKTGSSLTSGQHVLLVTAFVGAITAAFVTISGGGQSPEQGSSQEAVEDQEVSQDSKPVLAPAGLDVVPELQKAGSPWDAAPFADQTSYTGGSVDLSRRSVSFPMGSISVDRADYGGVHMVIIGSGMGERCGDPAALGRAYLALAGPLDVPLPSEAQLAELNSVWSAREGMAEITFPKVLVRAVGGCVSQMVIKATE